MCLPWTSRVLLILSVPYSYEFSIIPFYIWTSLLFWYYTISDGLLSDFTYPKEFGAKIKKTEKKNVPTSYNIGTTWCRLLSKILQKIMFNHFCSGYLWFGEPSKKQEICHGGCWIVLYCQPKQILINIYILPRDLGLTIWQKQRYLWNIERMVKKKIVIICESIGFFFGKWTS